MPTPARLFAAVLLLASFSPLAGAQQPAESPLAPPELLATPDPAPQSPSWITTPWHVDLMLGFPGGLRAQRSLLGSQWLVEAFVGLELVVLPTAGLGVRRQLTLLEGTNNALLINPGLDFYLTVVPEMHGGGLNPIGGSLSWRGGTALIGDIDVIWCHALGPGACSQLGLKLGAGPVSSHRFNGVVPVVSVFLGWGF